MVQRFFATLSGGFDGGSVHPHGVHEIGRVERWRGGLGFAYLFPALSLAGASLALPCPVSTSRSSNRTCGFPASGFRIRFNLKACAVLHALR